MENLSTLECTARITEGGSAEEFCGRKIRARGRAPAIGSPPSGTASRVLAAFAVGYKA